MKKFLISILLLFSGFQSIEVVSQIQIVCKDAVTKKPIQAVTLWCNDNVIGVSTTEGIIRVEQNPDCHLLEIRHPDYQSIVLTIGQFSLSSAINLIPNETALDEVVILASPFHRELLAIPGSVSVLPSVRPGVEPTISIGHRMEQVTGIQWQAGTLSTARLTIRGIGSRSPYATNRIRAYFDEIPLTGGDGATTVEDLELAETGRLEVIKGPSSALYGPGLGGTLLIRSSLPAIERWSSHVMMESGSFGLIKVGGQVAYRDSSQLLVAGLYRTREDGYRENSRYERTNALLRVGRQLKNHQLKLLIHYVDLIGQIPSSLNQTMYNETPEKAAPNWLAVRGFNDYQKWQGGVTLTSQLSTRWLNHLTLYGIFNESTESRPFNFLDETTQTGGVRYRLAYSGNAIELALGAEVLGERYHWSIVETLGGIRGEQQIQNHETRRLLNLFIHSEWELQPQTFLSAGFNLNKVNYTTRPVGTQTDEGSGNDYVYPLVWSPRIGVSHNVTLNWWFFASAGHGFSVPSSEEALFPDGSINRNLKPEEGFNVDAGIRGKTFGGRMELELTAYRIWVKNLLMTKRDAEEVFYGENAGRTVHQGIESNLKIDVLKPSARGSRLQVSLAHTWMDNRFVRFSDNDRAFDGNKLPGLPSSTLHARLNGQVGRSLSLQLLYHHINRLQMNDANTLSYPGYGRVDALAAYTFIKGALNGLALKASVQNLFNTHYASMILVNAPSFGGASPRYYYPGAPLNFNVGIRYALPITPK
jgi:iron complex outermembrane receptor protein